MSFNELPGYDDWLDNYGNPGMYDDYDPNSTENLPAEGWQHYADYSADGDQESLNKMFQANRHAYQEKYR